MSIAEKLGRYTAAVLCYLFAIPLVIIGFVVGFCSYHIMAGFFGGVGAAETGIKEIFKHEGQD